MADPLVGWRYSRDFPEKSPDSNSSHRGAEQRYGIHQYWGWIYKIPKTPNISYSEVSRSSIFLYPNHLVVAGRSRDHPGWTGLIGLTVTPEFSGRIKRRPNGGDSLRKLAVSKLINLKRDPFTNTPVYTLTHRQRKRISRGRRFKSRPKINGIGSFESHSLAGDIGSNGEVSASERGWIMNYDFIFSLLGTVGLVMGFN